VLLEYFGEKDAAPCGCCDVCADERMRTAVEPPQPPLQGIMQLLSDGELHPLAELDTLWLTRENLKTLLRELCDDEKIIIDGDKIKLNK
jgi:hypothetical protein